jgi:hypothetical protein
MQILLPYIYQARIAEAGQTAADLRRQLKAEKDERAKAAKHIAQLQMQAWFLVLLRSLKSCPQLSQSSSLYQRVCVNGCIAALQKGYASVLRTRVFM